MPNNSNYQCTKKVEPKSIKSSAEERGSRLKQIRNMANLSRQKICLDCGLNVSTYKGWEIARHGGLPTDGAKKILSRIIKADVICTLEWLLHGEGNEPFILPKNPKNIHSIAKEIFLFSHTNKETIFFEIEDDKMLPFFQKGDYVAGSKKYLSNIDSTINNICIVQLENKKIIVRKVNLGTRKNHYMLTCTNQEVKVNKHTLLDKKLIFSAPVILHYRPS